MQGIINHAQIVVGFGKIRIMIDAPMKVSDGSGKLLLFKINICYIVYILYVLVWLG